MQLAGIRNFDKVSACCQLRLWALQIKMNGVTAGRLFSVHFSGWFTSTHVNHLLRLFLGKKCSLPMSVSKNAIRKVGHCACLGDLMGQTYPVYACTGTNQLLHYISSRYILLRLEARFLK